MIETIEIIDTIRDNMADALDLQAQAEAADQARIQAKLDMMANLGQLCRRTAGQLTDWHIKPDFEVYKARLEGAGPKSAADSPVVARGWTIKLTTSSTWGSVQFVQTRRIFLNSDTATLDEVMYENPLGSSGTRYHPGYELRSIDVHKLSIEQAGWLVDAVETRLRRDSNADTVA